MYTILVNNDDTLLATNRERIMQRSKLVDKLVFIVDPIYRDTHDMTGATVLLEYVRPISKKYETINLVLSTERYKDYYLQYMLPFDTNLTSEFGSLEMQLTFAYTELDADGSIIQRVRKTSPIAIEITPISAWSDLIPDSALSALDQRLIKLDAQMRGLNEMSQVILDEKADNIRYNENTNELQLVSGDNAIGDKVVIKTGEAKLEDGVPVVDFSDMTTDNPPVEDEEDNVVEF